jgi:hypothetical protein
LKKEKEEEMKKESVQNMKKRLTEMNQEIRKTNLIKNEKLRHKESEPLFNFVPWGGDQTQFNQETIEHKNPKSRKATTPSPFRNSLQEQSRNSISKSEKAEHGMDFL